MKADIQSGLWNHLDSNWELSGRRGRLQGATTCPQRDSSYVTQSIPVKHKYVDTPLRLVTSLPHRKQDDSWLWREASVTVVIGQIVVGRGMWLRDPKRSSLAAVIAFLSANNRGCNSFSADDDGTLCLQPRSDGRKTRWPPRDVIEKERWENVANCRGI